MLNILIRTIFLYTLVLIVMRFMGKKEIGQMQPFELAISIMIADLASTPMADTGIPITNGAISILALLVMYMIISFINLRSVKLRSFICGKPAILIYRGKIDQEVLKKENFTINDLQTSLRANNIINIGDVEYAILETSGQVSVIQKPEKKTPTVGDLGIEAKYEGIAYDLIVDGKIMYENLKKIGKDENWLKKEIKKFKCNPEEVLIATLDGNNQIFCQKKNEKK